MIPWFVALLILASGWFSGITQAQIGPGATNLPNTVTWTTTVTNLRGQNGQPFAFLCPPNGAATATVWGTDIYTDDSSVCIAAVHAGVIMFSTGGPVVIEIRPGQSSYAGTTRNGVISSGYAAWSGSFVFVTGSGQPQGQPPATQTRTSPPAASDNLALNKPAQQSSTSSWSHQNDSQGAVDGVKNGYFGFHTNSEPNPWWQVDLQSVSTLAEVRIFNRLDLPGRAGTIQVLLSNDGVTWRKVYAHDGRTFGGNDGKPLVVGLNGAQARFVRLQLGETTYLHLDEVEVYGTSLSAVPSAGAGEQVLVIAYGKDETDNSDVNWNALYPNPSFDDDPARKGLPNARWQGAHWWDGTKLCMSIKNLEAPYPPAHTLAIGYTVTLQNGTFEDGSQTKTFVLYRYSGAPAQKEMTNCVATKTVGAGGSAGLVETLVVPNDKPGKVTSRAALEKDHWYRIEVSGVVSDWPHVKDGVDAVWCYAEWRCGKSGEPWNQLRIDDKGMTELADGNLPMSADHVYEVLYKGQGRPLVVYATDAQNSWSDNSGAFTVKIFEGATTPVVRSGPPEAAVGAVTWETTAAAQRGKTGQQFTYACPAGGKPARVWGTDVYTDDSSVCTAAVHAGRINPATGGAVTIEITPGQATYMGTGRNGILSESYGAWSGSFVFYGSNPPPQGRSSKGQLQRGDALKKDDPLKKEFDESLKKMFKP
jgi:hypothetical protein